MDFLPTLDMVNCAFLDGDAPLSASYSVYIFQLIRFARVSSHVDDFNTRNKVLTAKLLRQGYRYHKIRKAFSEFFGGILTLFNTFLERIMSDALEEHDWKVSIGGRNITNLRFADDIDALAEEEQELEALVESLDKTCTRYKMEINAEKTKLMTNSANGIQREIKVKGQMLGTVTSFKYLGAVVSDDGSKQEVLSRIAQATTALTKLKPIWRDNNISLGSKVKLIRSLVISIFLYACESWTVTAELEKRTQAFEMRCYRRLLNISYKDHVTNEEVRRKIQAAIGEYDELLTLVKKRKLRWFGHVSRSSGLAKTILQGTVKGKRKRDRQKKRREDNIKEWAGMDFASSTRAAENRSRWKGIVANSSVVHRRPSKVMG